MGYAEKLSNSQRKAIEELKMRMKEVMSSEKLEDISLLYRFLKARDFDVEKAEKMLKKNLIWRKSFQVDTILKDFKPKEFFHKYIVPSHLGLDKDGEVVEYCAYGKLDGRDVLRCVKMNDYMRHWIWFCEGHQAFLEELKEKTGKECIQSTFIIDLDKLTLGNVTNKQTVEICLRLTRILCDNYPEFVKSIYVINAPGYYLLLFSIMRAVMSREMLQKLNVSSYDGWKDKLLKVIDADVLPVFLGGNRTDLDGNPLCNTFVSHCGKIAEIYYLPKAERLFKNPTQVKKITVPPKAKEEVYIDITESGSVIQWEFLISNRDIGFGLYYKAPGPRELVEILPSQRYDTIDGVEVGNYKTEFAEKYVIIFDNSYSQISSKEIEYCITVINPGL